MIGVFGGTFDPVHHGHLRIVLDAQEALALEQVRLIPLDQAVHREQPRASATHRLAMLELALRRHANLLVDDREIRRGGPSFMVDTLESLHAELPGKPLCLLLGGDAFNGFAGWRSPGRILELANILVMQRPGFNLTQESRMREIVEAHRYDSLGAMRDSVHGGIYFHEVTQLDISSSDIRARVSRGQDPAFLLPDQVLDYLRSEGLYRQ